MAGLVDKEKERGRLEKQAAKLTKDMEVLETRLRGSNFVEKVLPVLIVVLHVLPDTSAWYHFLYTDNVDHVED